MPSKITVPLPSIALAVKVNSVLMVSPERVPVQTPAGERVSVAVASGSCGVPPASLPATLTVTESMSSWPPFAEATVSGPATRTVTDVVAERGGRSAGGL